MYGAPPGWSNWYRVHLIIWNTKKLISLVSVCEDEILNVLKRNFNLSSSLNQELSVQGMHSLPWSPLIAVESPFRTSRKKSGGLLCSSHSYPGEDSNIQVYYWPDWEWWGVYFHSGTHKKVETFQWQWSFLDVTKVLTNTGKKSPELRFQVRDKPCYQMTRDSVGQTDGRWYNEAGG